jgi:hypothetical protein
MLRQDKEAAKWGLGAGREEERWGYNACQSGSWVRGMKEEGCTCSLPGVREVLGTWALAAVAIVALFISKILNQGSTSYK